MLWHRTGGVGDDGHQRQPHDLGDLLLAGSLAAVAGLVYLLQFNGMRYDTGFELGLIAFTAAVLGGIGNLTGAVVGAVVIGLVQALNEGLDGTPGSDWTRSIVFGILIPRRFVFRPEGILGERTPEGVGTGATHVRRAPAHRPELVGCNRPRRRRACIRWLSTR